MRRALLILACVAVMSTAGSAHFVFVVPATDQQMVKVLLSDLILRGDVITSGPSTTVVPVDKKLLQKERDGVRAILSA